MSVEEVQERQEKQRKISRDLLLILLLLLLGVCLMCVAGDFAIKLAPTFTLEADMGSGLDPNVEYALRSDPEYINPILPGILDDPAWIDVFLTPGAFNPGEDYQQPPAVPPPDQPPAPQETTVPGDNPQTTQETTVPGDNLQPTQEPTTVVDVPPTQPPKPKPTTPPKPPGPPPDVKVNLKVSITDGQSTYLPGSNIIYSIIVTNTSSNNMIGAVVQDFIPGKIDSWNWVCKTVTNASGCDGITGNSSDFTDTVNIQAGGSIHYEVTALVDNGATGELSNTVTLVIPSGYQDTDLSNNSATDVNTKAILSFSADLEIDKNNNATTYTPGSAISPYAIKVTNNGPSPVIGATVTDIFDTSILTNIKWTCVTSGGAFCTGSGSGDINDTVSLLNGATITYIVTADAKSNVTGSLDNFTSVSVPAGYIDPNGGNNSDNDTDTAAPKADLAISKDNNVTSYVPGKAITPYKIVVTNNGPSAVTGATVKDNFSSSLSTITWSCSYTGGASSSSCPGSGNINDSVNLPVGAAITYTVNATAASTATADLYNLASVSVPAGVTSLVSNNNSDDDTDTAAPEADLAITKDNGVATYVPGKAITPYKIVVTNNGPSAVTGATVTDNFSSILSTITWSCSYTGGASSSSCPGSGNINDSVNLPVGATITYTVNATAASTATVDLYNKASVSVPAGVTSLVSNNNSDDDTDTAAPEADLAITKDNYVTSYVPGKAITPYEIVVTNFGPSAVTGATVTDSFSSILSKITWSCSYTGGASSSFCPGSGNINDSVNLPVGATITYTVNATAASTATADLYNLALVSVPAGVTSLVSNNNSDDDTDTPIFTTDLSISKVDNVDNYASGVPSSIIYTIDVSNLGLNDVTGAIVEDYFPREIESASWTCSTLGSGTCTASGSGDINDTVDIPAGETITYMVDATISAKAFKNIENTATVSAPAGVDSNPANDSATETTVPLLSDCVFSGPSGSITIPSGGCLFDRSAPGPTGNLYTITNNDVSNSVNFTWYGLGENQTSGACSTKTASLLPGATINNIAVSKLFGSTTIAIDNSSGSSVEIYITESTWSSGGCTNP